MWSREVKMSYLGEDIKKLGFGLMRLPQKYPREKFQLATYLSRI